MALTLANFDIPVQSARGVLNQAMYYNADDDTVTGAGYFNSVADRLGVRGFLFVINATGDHHVYPYAVAAGVVTLGVGQAIAQT